MELLKSDIDRRFLFVRSVTGGYEVYTHEYGNLLGSVIRYRGEAGWHAFDAYGDSVGGEFSRRRDAAEALFAKEHWTG